MPTSGLKTSVLERFLRYVTFDTQASETSETYPSTLSSSTCCGSWSTSSRRSVSPTPPSTSTAT